MLISGYFLRNAGLIVVALLVAGNLLAQLRLDAGDAAEAERLARRVLESEPDAAEVRNTLGLALQERGELAEARRVADEAGRPVPGAIEWEGGIRPVINQEVCTGCAMCRETCITEPKAVDIAALVDHD